MNIHALRRRTHKVEEQLRPPARKGVTLEQLCRTIWETNPEQFRKIAGGGALRCILSRFESEGARKS